MSQEAVVESPEKAELPIRLAFPVDRYSKRVYALILEKCQEWECSPAEAEARLLDQLAKQKAS